MSITLTQVPHDNIYLWAKTATLQKGGEVLFQTDLGITVLRINFTNAYCINLMREIDNRKGAKTRLIISSEMIIMNGVEHDNKWS